MPYITSIPYVTVLIFAFGCELWVNRKWTTMNSAPYVVVLRGWSIAFALLMLAALADTSAAQNAVPAERRPCVFVRASADCSVFTLTNIGFYFKAHSSDPHAGDRLVIDWGVMVNKGPRTAVGATWHVSGNERNILTGPALRYRRWMGAEASLDLGIGTNLGSQDYRPGGVIGIIKYNPTGWLSVGIEPEMVRRYDYYCGVTCVFEARSGSALHVGAELSGKPGLIGTLIAATLGAIAAAMAGTVSY